MIHLGKRVHICPTANIYGEGKIGDDTKIANFVEIADPDIGKHCKIQAFVYIPSGVHIGNYVFIAPHVCFTNDKLPRAVGDWKKAETIIEAHVSICANATILPALKIGHHAIVAAGAVVTKNVKANDKVAGNPARSMNDVSDRTV